LEIKDGKRRGNHSASIMESKDPKPIKNLQERKALGASNQKRRGGSPIGPGGFLSTWRREVLSRGVKRTKLTKKRNLPRLTRGQFKEKITESVTLRGKRGRSKTPPQIIKN